MAPLSLFLLISAIVNLVRNFGWPSVFLVVAAMWAFGATFKIRLYALKVQDRVIRLEEQLRLAKLLPESLKSRVCELTEDQLIGMRFASDGELSGLVEKSLAGKWSRKEVKQAIQTWRPDNWRV